MPRLMPLACIMAFAAAAHGAAPDTKLEVAKLPGIIVDDPAAEQTGSWLQSTHVAPYVGEGYVHDENKNKGEKSLKYTAHLPTSGRYQVALAYTRGKTRSTAVPIAITTADGVQNATLNEELEQPGGQPFMPLGVFRFEKDKAAVVEVTTAGTKGYVVCDAVQFLPVGDDVPLGVNLAAGKIEPRTPKPEQPAPEKKDPVQVASVMPIPPLESTSAKHEPKQPLKKITAAELDQLIDEALGGKGTADVADDEQFLRRTTLDLIGRQPSLAELVDFKADRSPAKRAAAVERLLADPAFGKNWANYWSDAIARRVQPPELTFMTYDPLKTWLAQEFNAGTPWDKMVTEMLTASGKVNEKPQTTFVAYHQANAVNLAGETTRLFLSVQIQCAECHDHPFDDWKQVQFHQMAAFFARAKATMPQKESLGAAVTDAGKGEQKHPKTGELMVPAVLNGTTLGKDKTDAERRQALATWITDADNPWFDKAFTNRVWARLFGRGFCEPVDNIGEGQDHLLPQVHEALADHFTASGCDIKDLFRLIMLSRAYQRPLPTSAELKQLKFAAAQTAKLRGDEVFDSLVAAVELPNVTPPKVKPTDTVRFPPPPKSTRDLVNDAFGFDPSFSPEMISRTMAQAMWLMNNEQLQQQVNSKPESGTLLAKLLAEEKDTRVVATQLFERVLARAPSDRELEIVTEHVASLPDRGAAFEDLLWSLLNSAEFTTKP